jgi:tetratricopeptide (TPR) repeat protein
MRRAIRNGWLAVAAGVVCACVLTGCRDAELAKTRHVERGDRLVSEGNYADAILEYRNAVRLDARFGEARYKLATAYEHENNLRQAAREYLAAAELLPDRADTQIKAGLVLLAAREFDRAKKHAEDALKVEPRNVDAQLILANALAGLKDIRGALAELDEAVQLAPDDARPHTRIGAIQAAEGNRAAALAAFRKAVDIDPKSVQARQALAYFYWSTKQLSEAEKNFQAAIDLDPTHVVANRMLALFYLSQNRRADAEAPLLRLAERKDTNGILALADLYSVTDQSDKARALYTDLAAQSPENRAFAVARVAVIDYREGHFDRAHQAIDGLLEEKPTDPNLLALKARWYTSERKLDDALAAATKAASNAPDSAAAQYSLGLVHVARSEQDQATKAFTEALRLNPRLAQAELQLSRLMLARGAADQALQHAEAARKGNPDNYQARISVATALLARRDLARADAELATLRKQYPQSPAVHALYGSLLSARTDTRGALRAFDRALELDPTDVMALTGRLVFDVQAKRFDQARARIRQALEKEPRNATLHILAARLETTAGDAAAAEAHLRNGIEADPASIEAFTMLARLYLRQQRLDDAKAEYQKLAQRRPDATGYKTMVGMIFDMQQQTDEAIKVYEEIINSGASAPVAANNLAYHYATRGEKLDLALQLAQTAKQRMPDRPEVNDTLGWVYYKKNLPDLAIAPLELSVRNDASNPVTHFHLGLAYAKAGQPAKARQALERALELKPDFDGADEARTTLASLKG